MRLRVGLALCLSALVAVPAASAASPLAGAYAKTAAAKALRVTMDGRVASGPVGVPFSASGEVDAAAGLSHFEFDLSKAAGAVGLAPSALRPELVVQLRPPVMFVRWPLLARALHTTKPWLKLDLAKLARTAPQLGQLSQLVQGADVAGALRLARVADGTVRTVGTATVRGARTTHYRTSVDYAKLAQTLPAEARKALLKTGARQAPLDVWVDGDGYIRRLAYSYRATANNQPLTTTTTFEFYDFGGSVDVALPPAGDVAEPPALKG